MSSVQATTPCPRTDHEIANEWMQRHQAKIREVSRRGKRIDIVLLGDSITQGWEDEAALREWQTHFGDFETLNLGFSGDCTEHLLWRLQNGEIDGLDPKLAVLLIGTNNTGHRLDPAFDTARGVRLILNEVSDRLPATKVLLLALLPRSRAPLDPHRQRNAEINSILAEFADAKKTHFLDTHAVWIDETGHLDLALMPDELHLSASGYRQFARALKPAIEPLIR